MKKERVRIEQQIGPDTYDGALDRDGEIQRCVVRKARDGEPVPEGADLVYLNGSGSGEWADAQTLYRAPRNGPAQVATPAYRNGYDRIFGGKQKVGLA